MQKQKEFLPILSKIWVRVQKEKENTIIFILTDNVSD